MLDLVLGIHQRPLKVRAVRHDKKWSKIDNNLSYGVGIPRGKVASYEKKARMAVVAKQVFGEGLA